jgi:transcription elongation factor GreB
MKDKNYITPQGFKKLQTELVELIKVTRPEVTKVVAWAASNGDRSENADYIYGKRRLREIDSRIKYLTDLIDAAEILDPALNKMDKVYFGSKVLLQYEDGREVKYQIVGVTEIEIEQGLISWKSPIAKAILNRKVGDVIEFNSPKGVQEIEILGIF